VRNTWYGRFSRHGGSERLVVFDEMKDNRSDQRLDPEALMIQRQAAHTERRAIEELPV